MGEKKLNQKSEAFYIVAKSDNFGHHFFPNKYSLYLIAKFLTLNNIIISI